MGRTRIVKVSNQEYELLQKVRQELVSKGSDTLPQNLRNQVEEQTRIGDLALGALIGLGAIAFLSLLGSGLADDEE
jgi:predicted transcriptional regulator